VEGKGRVEFEWAWFQEAWAFLFLPYPNGEACGEGQVGVDKKMKSAEHLVATKRWV